MKIGKRLRTGAKALAALAAGLLLFGAAACSHDSDGNKGRDGRDDDDDLPAQGASVTIGADADYPTIEAALKAAPTENVIYTIKLPKGTYNENGLSYSGSATIVIEGSTDEEYGADVIIAGKGSSQTDSKTRCLLLIDGSANLVLKNVTLESTLRRKSPEPDYQFVDKNGKESTQSEVLGFNSSGTVIAYNSSFKSRQDTIRTVGKAWFYKCYIEGDVDFLWMEETGIVALYEDCEIKMVGDDTTNAYIAAPRMKVTNKPAKGLVVYNSNITVDGGLTKATLARTPWNEGYYNQVAYINNTIDGTLTNTWEGSSIATDFDKTDIGWKLDKATADVIGHKGTDDVLSDRIAKREYNGRYVILNRVFNTETLKYEKAASTWDAAVALGISVAEDTSKNNIFLDYADAKETSIGDALTVTDIEGHSVTGVSWSVKAYRKYDEKTGVLSEEITDDSVTINEENGTITNNYSGNVYVEVTATKGAANDSIIVYNVTATGIKLSQTAVSVAEGSTVQLEASFEPAGASAEVDWTSSDPTVVTVEDGLVTAQNGKSGSTATITATIKDTDISEKCKVTVTDAVTLKKFGERFADTDEEKAYKGFGGDEVLIYDEAITPGTGVSASISATITTKAKQVGVGFVSFRDGVYNDGALDGMVFVTDQGVRFRKNYATGWNGSWTSEAKPQTDADSGATYTMTATLDGTTLKVTATNVENGKEYIYSNGISNFITATSVYLAIGGQSANAGETLDINSVEIDVSGVGGKVANVENLTVRDKVNVFINEDKAVLTLNGTGKGQKATITKESLPSLSELLSLSISEGKLTWDADVEIASSDWNGDKATIKPTFTFLPTDQAQYAAVFNKEVEITVTDERTEDNNSFDISWLDSAEASNVNAIVATNSNEAVAKGSTGTASDTSAWGGWSYNNGKLDDGKYGAKGGLTVSTSDANKFPAGYDTMYIDFPITATVACTITSIQLSGVNHGSGEIKQQISYKIGDAGGFTQLETAIATRQVKPDAVDANISLLAGQTLTLRVALGAASEVAGARSPTIGTVIVYGNKN